MTAHREASTTRPLAGATIVVTRAADRAATLADPLEALGAQVLTYAATQIVPRDVDGLQHAVRRLVDYDWVIFTSATSVALTFDAASACGVTHADWLLPSIAVVGSATADAVRARGLEPTLMPDRFVAEGMLDAFAKQGAVAGARMLYPAASGARPDLRDGLVALGASVHQVDAYDSIATDADVATVRTALQRGDVTLVTMTARSAVEAWVAAMSPLHAVADVISIGPVTTQAAHAAGMRVAAEATPATIAGLVSAVVRTVRAQRDRHHHQTNIP